MKFCYIDESGTGDEPYAVMIEIIVDAQRMNLTKQHWKELLSSLSEVVQRPIIEIHTRDFYAGNGPWRNIDGPQRAQIITLIFNWLCDRRHHIVYSAVDKAKFREYFPREVYASDIPNLWCFMALHLTLAIQKRFQSENRNKGNTVFIFDNEDKASNHFISIAGNPPLWTNEYYGKRERQEPLDQLIDAPYFANSKSVGLIQVADFVSYFFRRYIELKEHTSEPKYRDEEERVDAWMQMALSRSIEKSLIYPKSRRCDCAELFWRYAPECVKGI